MFPEMIESQKFCEFREFLGPKSQKCIPQTILALKLCK